VATATHGSDDTNGNLAAAVAGLQLVTSSGEIVESSRGGPDFDGLVVGLGALGAVTRITLDVEPAYEVRQRVFDVVDVRMPPSYRDEGLKAAVKARRRVPNLSVLVLSHYVEERYGAELLESGATGIGYLLKDRVADVPDFIMAVRDVASGKTVLDPEVVDQLLARRRDKRLAALTSREREVLSWPKGAPTKLSPRHVL
jgi:FAD/FMN-containing dehydrogenase